MRVQDIIDKRRRLWDERQDLDYDKAYIRAAARKILSSPELVEEVQAKPYLLIESAFYIVNKERATVPFFLNEVQRDFIGKLETYGTSKPFFILKGRQQGFTSLITAIQLSYAIVRKNFAGFTMADRFDNTRAIFNDKARVVYERLPEELKPTEKFNSMNELFFSRLNSSWRIATATDRVGRSRTLNFVHFSEVAFYECSLAELQKGIGEAITAGAIQVYETTANGFNEAKDLWDSESCHNCFYEWWRTSEYRSAEYEYLETTDPWLIERIELLKELGLDREQITWYCKKYDGYLDKDTIKQEYPITPTEAFISSGDSVFDMDALTAQLARLGGKTAGRTGLFTYRKEAVPIPNGKGGIADVEWKISDIRFSECREGFITLHEAPRVKRDAHGNITGRAPYAIGGDTAGAGEDYFTAKVICTMDGKTVATLRKQKIDEDLYAEQLYCLGKYYHDAIIGIETNYSRQPTRVLQRYLYPRLYLRERIERDSREVEMVAGFETTARTKPIIIGNLVELMREDPTIEVDVNTLKEMMTFVKKENGKQEAIDGYHDDLVMALAIAHHIKQQQTHDWQAVEAEEEMFIKKNFHEARRPAAFMEWEEF